EELIRLVNDNHKANMSAHDKSSERIRTLEESVLDLAQKSSRRSGGDAPVGWGAQVVSSEGYRSFTQTGMRGRVSIGNVKSALTTAAGSAGDLIAPDRASVTMMPRQRFTVRSLLAPGRTNSNAVDYPVQTGRTLNAGTISEYSTKPQSDLAFSLETANVRTIAHWIPVSRQAMSDAPQLQSIIDSELQYGLALEEEAQLLSGDGTGENLHGLIPQATAYSAPFSVTNETMLDTLLLAIAQAQQSKVPATGIVVNDLDWAKMQALKDGQDRYLGAGPFGQQPAVAWQVAVVPTPSMTAGHFLVGGFAQAAQIYDRQDPEILIADQHADFFVKNMLAILCEERLALAVKLPEALIYGAYP
ncbi:MAG: phage major capsid protein, partial [Ignavibacteriales bacterium]